VLAVDSQATSVRPSVGAIFALEEDSAEYPKIRR
jgi:hypothetical protein